jgi:hypothetical protein
MEVALVGDQLCGRDVLERDRVVRGISDDSVAGAVVVGGGQQRGDVGKNGLAELQRIGRRREAGQGDIAKIRREHEAVMRGEARDLA